MSFKKIRIKNYLETEPEIFATIRPESKYLDQQQTDNRGRSIPFLVKVDFRQMHYCVVGNGNSYRLSDVDLWISLCGSLETVPMHEPIYRKFDEQLEYKRF